MKLFSLEGGENLRDSISKSCSFKEKKFGEKLSFSLPICSSIFRFLLDSRSFIFDFALECETENGCVARRGSIRLHFVSPFV